MAEMNILSIGKIRGLQQITSADGIFAMCAMDHRGSLRRMINRENPHMVDYKQVVERKLELCSSLAEHTSAVLLDPVFGVAQCLSHNLLPKSTGLLVSIEASGYSDQGEGRLTELLSGWGVDKIKRIGASAVKILLYYRSDFKQSARKQMELVNMVAAECITQDIPFLVEPVSYMVGDEIDNPREFAGLRERLVIDAAGDVNSLPVDVLKTEFPADLRYKGDESELIEICRKLDTSSRIPWVLLSAGVDFELFCRQVKIACQAGASGFLGGRAIWQEAMDIDDAQDRRRYLSTVCADRLKRLAEIAGKYAVPWYKKLGLTADRLTDVPEGWYLEY